MKSARITVASILFLAVVAYASFAYAGSAGSTDCFNGKFCALAKVEGSKLETLYGIDNLGDFVTSMFTFALSAGAILAVLRLAWAGYLYMTTDSWGSKGRAKEVIGDAVLGLLLLLGIWLILHQINPDILKMDFLQGLNRLRSP